MKTRNLFYIFLIIAIALTNCKKNDEIVKDENDNEDDFITMEIGGTNYKSVSIDDFNSLSDSSNWNIYPDGVFLIDTVNKFNEEASVNLTADGGCFKLEKIEGVPVDKEKIYVIHFHYKLLETQIGEAGHCVGDFMIWLKQGGETLLLDGCQGIESWTEKYFYFQPINNVPVKIELLVGTEHGVWLDDLIVFEEY